MKNLLILSLVCLTFTSCLDTDDSSGQPQPGVTTANVFVTNNIDGDINIFDFTTTGTFFRSLGTPSNDAEGVFYDTENDQLLQVSRSQNTLNLFANIDDAQDNGTITPIFTSPNVLESPRDIAVNGDVIVVSDNSDVDGDLNTDDGRFFVFTKTGNSITLRNTLTVDFAVWGIEFIEDDLFVVVDKTADIAMFSDFANTNTSDATIAPTKRITIEGITRTHGIAFDDSVLVLTDIGEATGTGADVDGGIHQITGFLSKFNMVTDGGTLPIGDQSRVSGSFTSLGNPVAVDFDGNTNTIIVAERANNGGRLLFFESIGVGGNLVPNVATNLEGASSVYFTNR